jgi:hypothetical protein
MSDNVVTDIQQVPAILRPGRDEHGRFLKGFSGNPSGRPVGVEAMIRSMTNDGKELLEVLTGYALGDPVRARCEAIPAREQRQAAQWLAERLWGKTPALVGVVADVGVTANLTNDERMQLARYILASGGVLGAEDGEGDADDN